MNDYIDQNLYCYICYEDFIYSSEEQKEQCEKNHKYYWWYPKCCPLHQPLYESMNLTRKEMNRAINAYFHALGSLQDAFSDTVIYFNEIGHGRMNLPMRILSKDMDDIQKIAYIKKASRYNSENAMMLCLQTFKK